MALSRLVCSMLERWWWKPVLSSAKSEDGQFLESSFSLAGASPSVVKALGYSSQPLKGH
jgi:hypothetical protein